jgi:enoyl-CoA hydratase
VIAQSIAAKSPLAVRGSKEALLYSRDHSVSDSLNFIATWNSGMLSEADVQAGLQAQLEKRPANYED